VLVHIGERALLDIKLIWFGYIPRLSQWGGGGISLVQIILPAVAGLEEGWGVSTLCQFVAVLKFLHLF
jgi:hypothetical protein